MDKLYEFLNIAIEKIIFFVPKLVLAGIIIWIGLKIIAKITEMLRSLLEKADFSPTISPFIVSVLNVLLKIGLLFIVAAIIGADLTGFIAILAAAGFAIGMALQGSLGNFASGILVLSFKPYKVNDWIKIEDNFGRVDEIGIFNTKIITRDFNTLIVPNSKVTDSILTNYSEIGTRRVAVTIPVPYTESFPRVKALLMEAILEIPTVLKDPEPIIEIENFDTHNVMIAIRPYAEPDNYWETVRETYATVKRVFHENDIKIAYVEGYQLGEIAE
ncbi:MAG: mechanosensitive ion channel family protein [Lutimonas sp.]